MDRQQVSAPNLEPTKKVEQEATVYAIDLQDNGSPTLAKTVSNGLQLSSSRNR